MANNTANDMEPDDRTFHTTRTLPHTPDAVYAAFQMPEMLAIWWGPEGFTNTFELFEFKVGGQWRFLMHSPDGKDYLNQNVFQALEPSRQVVIRHDCAPYFTLTITLAQADEGTHLTWEQVLDDATTAQAIKSIVIPANEQNLDRLTRVLAASSTT